MKAHIYYRIGEMMNEIASIEEFENKYQDEWILVEVIEKDDLNQPKKGKLIAHSRRRDDIYDEMRKHHGHTAIFFSGEIPKKGYAFCF